MNSLHMGFKSRADFIILILMKTYNSIANNNKLKKKSNANYSDPWASLPKPISIKLRREKN